jgi:hypothetical protein
MVRQRLSLSLSLSLNIEETFQNSPLHSLFEYLYSPKELQGRRIAEIGQALLALLFYFIAAC